MMMVSYKFLKFMNHHSTQMNNMRIAIFHNFMDNIGGAELVDLLLARELGADIYTTNIDREKIEKTGFSIERIFSIGSKLRGHSI